MTIGIEDPKFRFLAEGGETGREILMKDWSGSVLGPLAEWPVALRTTLATMLACPVPMFLAWGPDLVSFFNDAYREVLGDRVSRALGVRFPELWADLWPEIGPLCARALAGEGVSVRDLPLTMHRRGQPERTWWTFSYSPVHDDDGAVAGMICITRETTAQILAEKDREDSRSRLDLALSAGDGIGTWDWDVAADRVTADARFARLYGVDPDRAAAGAPIAEFFGGIHPDDLPAVQERIAAAMRTGGDFAAEYRLVQPDGVRWVAAQGQCVLDADGRPVQFPGVTFDITERRDAEDAVRAAARELRLVADALPSLIAFIDPTLTYRFANAAYETWFSRPLSEVIGRTVRDLVDEDGFARREPAFAAALGGEDVRFEMEWPHPDGRERVADIRYIPRRDGDGAVDGFYAFVQDITDRTRIEAALTREVESRTRERNRLWETTTDLMGTAGLDGYLKAVNPAWTRVLGWSREELLGEPFATIIDTADHAETAEVVAQLARGETVDGFVDHVIRKDGERLTISWNAVPEGDLFYIVGRDITEQRAVEELLRQAQKMEAVGQLTGGIAHDFNNLLTGIVGSLDLMQTRIKQGRTEQIEKYATAALSSANRAAALTHRLLAFARRQPLEPKPTDANGLIAGMEDMLRRTLTEQVNLEIVTAGGLWLTLCDPHQLENALLNLAINARDAMPDGGRLVIETCNTHLDRAYERLHPEVEPGQYICVCDRRRHRHERGRGRQGLRPVLHHEAAGPGHRPRPVDDLRLRQAVGGARQDLLRAGIGHDDQDLPAALPRRGGGRGHRSRDRHGPARRARRDGARRRGRPGGARPHRRGAGRARLPRPRGRRRAGRPAHRGIARADRPDGQRRRPARPQRAPARRPRPAGAARAEDPLHHRLCRERDLRQRRPRPGHADDHQAVPGRGAGQPHPRDHRGIGRRRVPGSPIRRPRG